MVKTKFRKNLVRHPRLNPDWPLFVRKFDCTLLAEPPQQLWDIAYEMRRVWNECVALMKKAQALDTKDEQGNPLHSKGERAAIWLPFQQRKTSRSETNEKMRARYDLAEKMWGGVVPSLHEIGTSRCGVIPSHCYESVVNGFLVTFKEWMRGKRGAPCFHNGPLHKIFIPHVFNLGITATQLAAGAEGVRLADTRHLKRDSAAKESYLNNAHFEFVAGGGRARLPLHAAFAWLGTKRNPLPALPENCRIKQVALIGRRNESLAWRWQLQVRLEAPALPALPKTGRVAGLDLGWRMRDGYLRVGLLRDNAGHTYELCLPLEGCNRKTRKLNRYALVDQAEHLGSRFDPARAMTMRPNEWSHLDRWQSELDEHLEACKQQVRAEAEILPEQPKAVKTFLSYYDKSRRQALLRLQFALRKDSEAPAVLAILDEWRAESDLKARRLAGASAQFVRVRNDAYRKLAAWLAVNFDVVAWEGDLNLKAMAEDDTTDPALRNAAGWRFVACLSDLRRYIPEAMKKRGRELIDRPAAYSTSTCVICGGDITDNPRKLVRVCENGHSQDQDSNASDWFLSEIEGHASIAAEAVAVPLDLRRYVRVMG